MARPPAHSAHSAVQRIEEAFWGLLSSMKYDDITIAALARHAHINHNTIYYHYRNPDDVAFSLIDKLTDSVPLEVFAQALVQENADGARSIAVLVNEHPEVHGLFARAALIGRSGSSDIIAYLRKRVEERWLGVLGIAPDYAEESLRLLLTFMTGGMLSVVSTVDDGEDVASKIVPIFGEGISQAFVSTLTRLAARSQ